MPVLVQENLVSYHERHQLHVAVVCLWGKGRRNTAMMVTAAPDACNALAIVSYTRHQWMQAALRPPSARKRLQIKIWRFCFRFRSHNGMANDFTQIFFSLAFVMIMLGTHKPQQQATLTKQLNVPEIFFLFCFRNLPETKSQIQGFYFSCS